MRPPAGEAGAAEPATAAGELPLRVRRSARARRTRVSVDGAGTVEVVLPRGTPARAADEAVRELRPWIDRRRGALAAAAGELSPPAGTVPLLGARLALVAEPGRRRAERRGADLLVPGEHPRAAVEAYYRRTAREEVSRRLDAACARAARSHRGLTIRGQRTRWASCSSRGAMSFNWRLLMAPAEALDYVVEHEVCHLDVPDHSDRFWALLEQRMPAWRSGAGWLRRYGALLLSDAPLRELA